MTPNKITAPIPETTGARMDMLTPFPPLLLSDEDVELFEELGAPAAGVIEDLGEDDEEVEFEADDEPGFVSWMLERKDRHSESDFEGQNSEAKA
jgi:hypothetical protein